MFHWTGVRPMPFVPGYEGKQNLIPEFHHHDDVGLENFMSVPGGPLMVHRYTGRRIAREVAAKIQPSGTEHTEEYDTFTPADQTNSW